MKIGNIELTQVFPKELIDKIDFWIKAKRISSTDQEGGTSLIFLVTDNGNGNAAMSVNAESTGTEPKVETVLKAPTVSLPINDLFTVVIPLNKIFIIDSFILMQHMRKS